MRVAVGLVLCMLLASIPVSSAQSDSSEEDAWPGDPVDSHVHMTWAALTLEVNEWADDYPEIVDLTSIGQSELGKTLWVVRISNWSMDAKFDGTPKEIVYIDGGHHGNEYLGTALAWLTAKWYINGWAEGNQEAIDVLDNTELHITIMLNPDGNDIDTRWNINQVDLNRNYDHYWNTCPTTQPGSSAFSESETAANGVYMNTVVPDADLYVTMHTGVWIMLYPWGKWPEQPADWELYHKLREDVQNNISSIPIQNANQGLYPNCGTSRDYGYGVMGYPTFTFETDDEQFVPGSFENLNERLGEEMDVMSKVEIEARYEIELEEYTKKIQIESRVLADISRNHVVPTAIIYQNTLLENTKNLKEIFGENFKNIAKEQIELIMIISNHITEINALVNKMTQERKNANKQTGLKSAELYCNKVKPYFEEIRYHCDKLETMVDDNLWPLTKYRELLFTR